METRITTFFSYTKYGCHPQDATIYSWVKLKTMTPKTHTILKHKIPKPNESLAVQHRYDSAELPSAAGSMGDILILSFSYYHSCIWLLLLTVCFPKLGAFLPFCGLSPASLCPFFSKQAQLDAILPVLCICLWSQQGTSCPLRLRLTSLYVHCCWEETCPGSQAEATDAAE